jgi:hypothetical protein
VVTICTASGHYMYRQWSLYVPPVVTICTARLTFHNSTFRPHSVFTCFMWIWEQTAIISLYNINWLVYITETECVYCAVRTDCLYIIQVILVWSVYTRWISGSQWKWPLAHYESCWLYQDKMNILAFAWTHGGERRKISVRTSDTFAGIRTRHF